MIYSRIPAISEVVNRHRIKAAEHGEITEAFMLDLYMKEVADNTDHLEKLIQDSKAVFKDQNLTDIGQRRKFKQMCQEAQDKQNSLDMTNTLTEGVIGLTRQADGAVKGERDKHRVTPDTIVSVAERQEIRQHYTRQDEQAEAKAAAWIAERKAAGKPISDQEYTPEPPSKADYLEGCRTYGPEKEQFLRAMDSAPWPLGLDVETIQEGNKILRSVIAPDQVEELQKGEMRLAFHKDLQLVSNEIIQAPAKHSVFSQGTKKPQPDNPETLAALEGIG